MYTANSRVTTKKSKHKSKTKNTEKYNGDAKKGEKVHHMKCSITTTKDRKRMEDKNKSKN